MPNQNPKIIILLGRSGSGKGTQAKLLIEEFGLSYISSGKLLRARAQQDDFTGKNLKKVLDRGDRAPSFLIFQIWSQTISSMREKINKNGLVIDGSPRTLSEAELIDELLQWYQWLDIRVILLDISEQEAFDRLTKRYRSDDKPEAIKERLAFYRKDVEPAIDHYEKQGRLIKINGEKPIEHVYHDIKQAINSEN
ncbi:MAG: hypothetical protein CMI55_03710 [Parcubacteria group bacterium]|jgi:adenylate kinase|nr:hypothetical protein [Parcubacteria group bacterium]|tara:strand:- start:593 stop:1177 length:585 start_codon:yes stop_codon:yes gene_type:complete